MLWTEEIEAAKALCLFVCEVWLRCDEMRVIQMRMRTREKSERQKVEWSWTSAVGLWNDAGGRRIDGCTEIEEDLSVALEAELYVVARDEVSEALHESPRGDDESALLDPGKEYEDRSSVGIRDEGFCSSNSLRVE